MKSAKITSIAVDENDSILTSTYDYVSEKGIKITLNGKNDIVSLTIPQEIKNLDNLEDELKNAINHAHTIVREMIQSALIKELIKQEPQLLKDLKLDDIELGEVKKS
jgi:DNA-binding protein YbaB